MDATPSTELKGAPVKEEGPVAAGSIVRCGQWSNRGADPSRYFSPGLPPHAHAHPMRSVLLTFFALLMFAANSLLCRMALHGQAIDAASFSTLRLASGALMLLLLVALRRGPTPHVPGDWRSAFWLFLYAVPFSFAYLGLTTGTGALVLFGAVQLTMLLSGWRAGERPGALQWTGILLAFAGLVWLLVPGLAAPPLLNASLMALAGVAWGIYSLRGRRPGDPVPRNAGNFLRAVPMVAVVSAIAWPHLHITAWGAAIAMLSGAIASAIGYAAWYGALKRLTATRAAVVQLSVPVIAAVAGTLLLAEPFTLRLVVSSVLVLGGVAITLARPHRGA